mgnify:CR=1 FL=1
MKKLTVIAALLIIGSIQMAFAAGSSSSSSSGSSNSYGSAKKYSEKQTKSDLELRQVRNAIAREDYRAAIAEVNVILEEKPNFADAWNLLGYSSRKSGDFKTAKAAYTKALAIDPKHTQAMEYMGEMYLSLNQPAEAEKLLSRLNKLCSFNCEDRDLLKAAIKKYKSTRS